MIQKCLCVLFLIVMIGCKPESPLSPGSGQQDSVHTHKDYLYTEKEMFTLYVDNTYNVDQDITIYMRPFGPEVIIDYCIYEGLNSVGVACGGECTEMGVFGCDSLTYLTAMYGKEEIKDTVIVRTFTFIMTEDTVNTLGMSEYTWVFDEQTRWCLQFVNIIIRTGIEE